MATIDKMEQRVLDVIQQDFPIASRPYEVMADRIGASRTAAILEGTEGS